MLLRYIFNGISMGKLDAGAMAPKLICNSGGEARQLRKLRGLNQLTFWSRIGTTQSGGSRYESGRDMPKQVAYLLHLAYGTDKQASELMDWLRR